MLEISFLAFLEAFGPKFVFSLKICWRKRVNRQKKHLLSKNEDSSTACSAGFSKVPLFNDREPFWGWVQMDQGVNLQCVTKGNYVWFAFSKNQFLLIARRFVFNFEIYSAQKCHSRISFNHKSCLLACSISFHFYVDVLTWRDKRFPLNIDVSDWRVIASQPRFSPDKHCGTSYIGRALPNKFFTIPLFFFFKKTTCLSYRSRTQRTEKFSA